MKTEKQTYKMKRLEKIVQPLTDIMAALYRPWAIQEEEESFSHYGDELNRQYHQRFLKIVTSSRIRE